ncbi:CPBP family intramembrane glutamic endopeptidase [Mycobacterium sp. 1274756.6]|uniref:Rv0804 family intramembrane glutamic endopeptidase n=1 Tax=Mycobacterium sp. 1274756.6 TaxID=1834076 RepID=UPI0007FF2A5C|nr:CPBP family intramembrane glutamic endopeptidase [Mycobacterium sp. 1274756.6]OBJ70236.1 abortive phage infection protein [Mycobacterium sp. 1274756.6]
MTRARMRALLLGAGLIGWSFATAAIPTRWRTPVQALLGTALAAAFRAPLGLHPARLGAGLRLGLPLAGTVAAGAAAATAVPPVRAAMAVRALPPPAAWLLWRIPLGTVWAEEAAFRGALATAAEHGFGPTGGRVLQSATFGLFHIADARSAGTPVLPTVAVTAAAGWLFDALARRSGSLAAPLLAHLAINQSGALAALAVQRVGR